VRIASLTAAAALAACGPSVEVRTAVAPEASTLAGRRTFRIIEADRQSNGNGNGKANGYGIHDPMVENPITSGVVHDHIKAAFEALGYRNTSENADFDIAYRATVAPILDIRTRNYGGHGYYGAHGWYDGYPGYCCGYDGFGYAVARYDRNTVIIDAIDPASGQLLWRAQGTADAYDNPKRFLKSLGRAVKAIARKFPASAVARPVAVVP
jgi:hypothetical protein